MSRKSFLPKWQTHSIWEQKQGPWPGSNHIGPLMHELYFPTKPTPQDLTETVSLPHFLPGKWKCIGITFVKQLSPGAALPAPEQPTK